MENKYSFDLSKTYTIRDLYEPAMSITDQADADVYFAALVEWMMAFHSLDEETARMYAKSNLGYYAGYFSAETSARVLRLFGAAHPIFGATRPTAEEAYEAGKRLAAGVAVRPEYPS